jgi:hypothetical protein
MTPVAGPRCLGMHEQPAFTETAFRSVRTERHERTAPSYAGQSLEVVALRARGRDLYGRGVGEWRIWETFAVTRSPRGSAYEGSPLFGHLTNLPTTLSPEQVSDIAREFSTRMPDYEFEVVRASLVIDESAAV